MSVHLVIPDQHAHPDHNNDRADLLGKLILDLKPDVVVNMGDAADMPSLCSYDKGTKGFFGRSYYKDIEAHLDFQDRMWSPIRKAKKKRPYSVVLEGNHEHRIKRVLKFDPHLEGVKHGLSFKDLAFDDYYHDVIEYEGGTPGITTIDGISYAHYFVSGVMGRPISSENMAAAMIDKNHCSSTAAHTHTVDWAVRSGVSGKRYMGLLAGVFQDYRSTWAGSANDHWWSGVIVKRNVCQGVYDPEFISMEQLVNVYGK